MTPGKAKPHGAERLELVVAYLEKPRQGGQLPPKDARAVGSYRRNPISVAHDPEFAGMAPTYWARWAGFNDDVSPWSLPCSMEMAPAAKASDQSGTSGQPLKLVA